MTTTSFVQIRRDAFIHFFSPAHHVLVEKCPEMQTGCKWIAEFRSSADEQGTEMQTWTLGYYATRRAAVVAASDAIAKGWQAACAATA